LSRLNDGEYYARLLPATPQNDAGAHHTGVSEHLNEPNAYIVKHLDTKNRLSSPPFSLMSEYGRIIDGGENLMPHGNLVWRLRLWYEVLE
jgi:hypothetical protein